MARRVASLGLPAALVLSILGVLVGAMPAAAAEPSGFEYFHTYAENEQIIDNVVAAHPNIAAKFSIGKSYEGRQIWGIKLTKDVNGGNAGKPAVFINGLMHARERASNELALYMLQVLGNNYGLSGTLGNKVTQILNSTIVYVVPMMNPDGAEFDMSGGRWHKWRKNRQPVSGAVGIDLNRQFGYTWGCCAGGASTKPSSDNYQGPSAFYAPEAKAYRDFVTSKGNITEILSLHSAAKQVLWPYSYTKKDVPSDMTADDHAAFVALGKGMAKKNGYKPKQGSDLYIVSGDQDDWAYGTKGIFAITIELPKGAAKRYYPTQSEINKNNSKNLNAVLWYLKQAGCPYAAAGLGGKHCGNSSSQQFYSQSVYNENAGRPQQTNCWCAVASTQAMLETMQAAASVSQTDINDYMTTRDKNTWTDPSFSGYIRCTAGSPSPSYAHDARGMAWALWQYATADQSVGFNDYLDTNQSAMNWKIVRGIRATGAPVGVIVVHGKHAMLAVGYQTALDPFEENGADNQILGFRVWDPWYNAGFGNWSGWPSGGFAPNAYVALSDWNSRYFTDDRNEGPYFQGQYVIVARSSDAQPPSDSPAPDYGSVQYAQLSGGDGSTTGGAASVAPVAAAPTVAQAVAEGMNAYGLLGDATLGNVSAGYTIGTVVHVRSMVAGVPSYDLAELRVGDVVRAVALVDEVSGGYRFGELRATTGSFRLPTTVELAAAMARYGLRGTPSLTWTWLADDPVPPFAPFLTGTNGSGQVSFVTPGGVTSTLSVPRGVSLTN
jgi:hypothetical protein